MTDEPSNSGAVWNDGLHFLMNQCTKDSHRWFPGKAQELPNLVLCMCGEAGEVANLVKKIVRGSITIEEAMNPEEFNKSSLQEEIVDVLIYLLNLMGAKEFKDVDWMSIWYQKREFNEKRFGQYVPDLLELSIQDEMNTRPEGADQ